MGMKYPVPKTPPKKLAVLIKAVEKLTKDVLELRRELAAEVERQVAKSLGDKIGQIDGALTESIIHKEILIEKGIFTRDEVNAKYAAMREKANG